MSERKNKIQNKSVGISCVVPVYNEGKGIRLFIQQLAEYLLSLSNTIEIVIVNDGSYDNTCEVLSGVECEIAGVKVLHFSRNFGKEMAITAGLEHVSLETVVIIDADYQHPFSVIKSFLSLWGDGYDMVYGLREDRDNESLLKRAFARTFYHLMSRISQAEIPANAGDFRLLDKKVVDAINSSQERARFMKGLYSWVGFQSIGIEFKVGDRAEGKSRWHLGKLVELAVTGIVAFSDVPLRIWSFIGMSISLTAFLSIIYIIFDTLIEGVKVPGYATLLTAIIFFGGLQLLSIGILGEYIAKIFNEVKQRPKYIIAHKQGFLE
jgi:polyisoprenyl-phosphate glycosyltransferase